MSGINEYSKVTLHFSLALTDGLIIDSTFNKSAATFVMGDGSLLPAFEKSLLGLRANDEKTVVIAVADAFGDMNPDNIHVMEKKQFKDINLSGASLSEGLVVSFDGAGTQPMPGVVKKMEGDKVTIDFNHPLAGQAIQFSVKIISVEDVIIAKSNDPSVAARHLPYGAGEAS